MLSKIEENDVLRICVQSRGFHDIIFKVKMKTNLRKVKRAYATLMNLPLNSLRFEYYGQEIIGNETPEFLGMKNLDALIAVLPDHKVNEEPLDLSTNKEPSYGDYENLELSVATFLITWKMQS